MIHEIQHSKHVLVFDAFQVQEGMTVWISFEDRPEERRASGEDDFVSLQLVPLTGQCYVEKVFVVPELSEGGAYVALELVPLEAEII